MLAPSAPPWFENRANASNCGNASGLSARRLNQAIDDLIEQIGRSGEVQTQEIVAAIDKRRARAKGHLGALEKELAGGTAQCQCRAIEPGEISGLRHAHNNLRQLRRQAPLQMVTRAQQLRQDRIEPALALAPGGQRGNTLGSPSTRSGIRRVKRRNNSALPNTPKAQRKPGRLKLLEAEVSVSVCAENAGSSAANGKWVWPG